MSHLHDCINSYSSKTGKEIYKPFHFADIYQAHLAPLVGREICLVELGIGYGGCLEMWREFLGERSTVFGIDLKGKVYNDPAIRFIYGDQASVEFLNTIPTLIPKIDVFIDDGSHVNRDQINTIEAVFPHLSPGGFYFVEDVHTSYRDTVYAGGYKKPGTFIEYIKDVIDALHHTENPRILEENPALRIFIEQVESISFYPTMVVIKKVGLLK